jgi:hypothetical protein
MPKRVMYTGGTPRQLDLPEKVATDKKGDDGKTVMRAVERVKKGALHLHPGRVHVLTEDELTLALKRKGLKKALRVLGDVPDPAAKSAPKAQLKEDKGSSGSSAKSSSGGKSRAKASNGGSGAGESN